MLKNVEIFTQNTFPATNQDGYDKIMHYYRSPHLPQPPQTLTMKSLPNQSRLHAQYKNETDKNNKTKTTQYASRCGTLKTRNRIKSTHETRFKKKQINNNKGEGGHVGAVIIIIISKTLTLEPKNTTIMNELHTSPVMGNTLLIVNFFFVSPCIILLIMMLFLRIFAELRALLPIHLIEKPNLKQ